jgi:L-asparaginase
MKIRLFSTGGTISKKYDEIGGELVFDKEHIEKMLLQGRCEADLKITSLMLKDSLEMDDKDRDVIENMVKNCDENKIIITHGTDTMIQSAKKLSKIDNKTIVFTGAMIPYAFKNSDSLFNIASAITAVQTLKFGVYICMNGRVFLADNVVKDKQMGLFLET